jgi:hypothetical protein
MAHKIKVVLGTDVKRESVLIDPNISATDDPTTGLPAKNVIAKGKSSKELANTVYGK